MTLRIAAIVNGTAKGNSLDHAAKERSRLERAFRNAKVDTTTKADLVHMLCQDYHREKVDVVIVSGGDGTVQNFLVSNFKENYRRFGKGTTPIEFARKLNRMALDPDSGIHLPALYHRKRGSVNYYANALGMKDDLGMIAENCETAEKYFSQLGTRAFPRVYVPIMMIYPKENQKDLDMIELMTSYGDGFAFNYFDQYYEPRKRGEESTFFTAMKVIAKGTASGSLELALDKVSELLFSSNGFGRSIYPKRYVDFLVPTISCEILLNGNKLPYTYRTVNIIGTIGTSLYGIKLFWRMPGRAEGFRAYYQPSMFENPEFLDASKYEFHYLGGNPPPVELSKMVPSFFLGKKANAPHVTDTLARRVEIKQEDSLRFICDGSRQTNGNSCVIEIAYLQPFILLDQPPRR